MNWLRARCRRAIWPCITTKRAPVSLTADAKSRPLAISPSVTWSRTSKSNLRGSPQRQISTFSLSSLPIGTQSSGILGNVSAMSRISASRISSSVFAASSSSPNWLTCKRNGSISSPRAFAWPMDFDRELRSACRFSVFTCNTLRRSSKERSVSTSSLKPRRASFSATASGSVRSRLGSSMLILCLSN